MKKQVTMNEHTCDGCGKVQYADPDDEQPQGYYISVGYIHGLGGDAAEDVFACKEACIRSAVVNALTDRGRG
jgi:hypothetical protein